jgi:chromosome segregation ATPase
MTTNPVDVVAGRHKEVRKARERIVKVQETLERERERREAISAEIAAAEQRDRRALGDALVDGRPEPAREAEELRAKLDAQERRIEALLEALDTAQAAVAGVVRENRSAWSRDQMQQVTRARARYASAIAELEAARDAFSDETSALAWIMAPEGGQEDAINATLGGRSGNVRGRPPLTMNRALEELRADLDAIDNWIGERHDEKPQPRLQLTQRAEPGAWAS